jgi:hypothetical protein
LRNQDLGSGQSFEMRGLGAGELALVVPAIWLISGFSRYEMIARGERIDAARFESSEPSQPPQSLSGGSRIL